jgi:hypothetical protein
VKEKEKKKKVVNPHFQVHNLPFTSMENSYTLVNQIIGERMADGQMTWYS